MIRYGWILLVAALLGCSPDAATPTRGAPTAAAEPPALTAVTPTSTQLMFRYKSADGWQAADAIEAVPVEARGAVQVVDLGRSPADRGAGAWVQITDLRAPGADGAFPSRWVPHADLEAELAKKIADKPHAKPVTMYSAAWCGVCKKARAFLDKQGIAYTEKDIEKDSGAARELQAKTKKAGVQAGGVPVFDVGGRILPGFDPDTLLRAVRGGS